MKLRLFIRWAAVAGFAAVVAWWVWAGRNPGWTKDKVAIQKIDEVLEMPYVEYEERFVPGVDLVAAAGLTALLACGLTFLGRKRAAPPEGGSS